jgi:heme exporter protein C
MLRFFASLANPTRFAGLADRLLPWLAGATCLALALGLYMALLVAPADYQQGESVRIMYIHVPAAWLALGCWTAMSIAALGTLVWRHPLADVAQQAAAPIGAAFTGVCLLTGSLWGRPTWGTWWVWDARLTSVLVLFLMYLGVMALWRAIEDPGRAGRAVAILTLVGFVNVPIVKFSVEWWFTLHQGASLTMRGSAIDPAMLRPLMVMALGYLLLFVTLLLVRMRAELMRRRLRRMALVAASGVAA